MVSYETTGISIQSTVISLKYLSHTTYLHHNVIHLHFKHTTENKKILDIRQSPSVSPFADTLLRDIDCTRKLSCRHPVCAHDSINSFSGLY